MSISKATGITALLVVLATAAAMYWLTNDDGPVSMIGEIEARTSRALGTRVDVSGSDVDWSEGRVSLSGVAVANPGGYSKGNMATAERVEIRGNLSERTVESISFKGVAAAIEFRGSNSNFESLSDRIQDAPDRIGPGAVRDDGKDAGGSGESEQDEESGHATGDREWTVERLEFEPIKVTVQADWTSKTVTLETGGFSIEGLGGDSDRLARAVTIEFLASVLEQAADRAQDSRLQALLRDKAGEVRSKMPKLEQRS